MREIILLKNILVIKYGHLPGKGLITYCLIFLICNSVIASCLAFETEYVHPPRVRRFFVVCTRRRVSRNRSRGGGHFSKFSTRVAKMSISISSAYSHGEMYNRMHLAFFRIPMNISGDNTHVPDFTVYIDFFMVELSRTESTKLNLFLFLVIGVRPVAHPLT